MLYQLLLKSKLYHKVLEMIVVEVEVMVDDEMNLLRKDFVIKLLINEILLILFKSERIVSILFTELHLLRSVLLLGYYDRIPESRNINFYPKKNNKQSNDFFIFFPYLHFLCNLHLTIFIFIYIS